MWIADGTKMLPAMAWRRRNSGSEMSECDCTRHVIVSPEGACQGPKSHPDDEPNEGSANMLQGKWYTFEKPNVMALERGAMPRRNSVKIEQEEHGLEDKELE